jgi:hypothetical protein
MIKINGDPYADSSADALGIRDQWALKEINNTR